MSAMDKKKDARTSKEASVGEGVRAVVEWGWG